MKKTTIFLIALLLSSGMQLRAQESFSFTWQTDSGKIQIRALTGTNNIHVNWGDGTEQLYSGNGDTSVRLEKDYGGEPDNYQVTITATEINTHFRLLNISENNVFELNISDLELLAELYCDNNQLTILEICSPVLLSLNCSDNQLKELSMCELDAIDFEIPNLFYSFNNALTLSNLYTVSRQFIDALGIIERDFKIGTQYWESQNIELNEPFSLAGEMVLGGVNTKFSVMQNGIEIIEDIDYQIDFETETITFFREGIFEVMMSNDAIISAEDYPALVIVMFYVGDVSVKENDKSLLSIYPNPTNGKLYIKSEKPIRNIQLYDLNGRLLQSCSGVNQTETELDISGFANGVYLLQVDGVTSKLIMKNEK